MIGKHTDGKKNRIPARGEKAGIRLMMYHLPLVPV
jgi:hypothetical protein